MWYQGNFSPRFSDGELLENLYRIVLYKRVFNVNYHIQWEPFKQFYSYDIIENTLNAAVDRIFPKIDSVSIFLPLYIHYSQPFG